MRRDQDKRGGNSSAFCGGLLEHGLLNGFVSTGYRSDFQRNSDSWKLGQCLFGFSERGKKDESGRGPVDRPWFLRASPKEEEPILEVKKQQVEKTHTPRTELTRCDLLIALP